MNVIDNTLNDLAEDVTSAESTHWPHFVASSRHTCTVQEVFSCQSWVKWVNKRAWVTWVTGHVP